MLLVRHLDHMSIVKEVPNVGDWVLAKSCVVASTEAAHVVTHGIQVISCP